ncbi:GNAT family N-acetyltransferase [Cryobacterium tepidiphilum]|uniref:GNAT family N-acetyltransferase n=1 Tax=Cryobacterium tepidiphilum TaxID=2486026 RepID=A0A3M8LAF6_9MICO|nr:GNAT family N-acetyltransferase [Cryobacterium tepidiphilum]RNE62483.1 GNAT family N-acetyltransferase [Cryobacterium tepidiphilum]
MPEFTPVSVTDAGALALLTQYFSDRESSFPSTQGTYRTTFPNPEQFVPPTGLFLLVSEDRGTGSTDAGDTVFVGCGGIRRLETGPGEPVRFEIKHLFLQPHVRGRRWGRVLLAELERRAREMGAEEVVLDTNSSLEAAGALYTRSGYVDVPPYNDNPNATNWYLKRLS